MPPSKAPSLSPPNNGTCVATRQARRSDDAVVPVAATDRRDSAVVAVKAAVGHVHASQGPAVSRAGCRVRVGRGGTEKCDSYPL